ncbi:HNH endonuclease family protein [Nocardiopsis coralliicola]
MAHRTPRSATRKRLSIAAPLVAAAAGAALLAAIPAAADPATEATPAAGPSAAGIPPNIPSASEASSLLAELEVREEQEDSPYDRSLFPHWNAVEGNCNAREYVLRRDGDGVETGNDCYPTAGSWFSEFDGETSDVPSDISIDHMVPLKEAWVSGADTWTTERRTEFANDVENPQLWAVTASINSEKGDKDPAEWMPPRTEIECDYAASWVASKHAYDLTVDDAEHGALEEVLAGC